MIVTYMFSESFIQFGSLTLKLLIPQVKKYTILVRPAKKKVYRYVMWVMSLCRYVVMVCTPWGTLSSFVINVVSSFFNRIHWFFHTNHVFECIYHLRFQKKFLWIIKKNNAKNLKNIRKIIAQKSKIFCRRF